MSQYYTNALRFGNRILERGYKDGIQFQHTRNYEPTLYVTSKEKTEYTNIHGQSISPMSFESINEAKNFIDKYDGVEGFSIYGNPAWVYQYLSDTYNKSEIKFDIDKIRIQILDIETTTEHSLSVAQVLKDPREEITLITVMDKYTKHFKTFTTKKFEILKDRVEIVQCANEKEMLLKFINHWSHLKPDVITGWNVKMYDIPYIVARCNRIFGDMEMVKQLSPWNSISSRDIEYNGKISTVYTLDGVSILDYLELYKKYVKTPQENYKLDTIAQFELGRTKLENPTDSFYGFYSGQFDITSKEDINPKFKELHTAAYKRYLLRTATDELKSASEAQLTEYNRLNDICSKLSWNMFCEYNIVDTELIDELEKKLKLIELQITIAYIAKVNYEDIFGQVKVWESIIYNHLIKQNKVPPVAREKSNSNSSFEGAYVKEPIAGKHKYMASFDLDSLYPHLIMMYNMSPETLVKGYNKFRDEISVDRILAQEIDTSEVKELNYSLSANGVCYYNTKAGFLPELMESMYADRKAYKTNMLKLESENEVNPSAELEYEISRLHNLQMALKIALNSLYGSVGNAGFRYFDLRIAEGITLSGQVSIRWISNKFNAFMNKYCGTTGKDFVLANDTDSGYFTLEPIVEKWTAEQIAKGKNPTEEDKINFMDEFCSRVLKPFFDKGYNELAEYMNAKRNAMRFKRESLADVAVFCAKKKYIMRVWDSEGVRYAEPKLKIVGLDIIKSSTPAVIKAKLKESVQVILDGSNDDLRKFVADYKEEFNTLTAEQIAFPRGVNNLEEYLLESGQYKKGIPINARAALNFNGLVKKHKLEDYYEEIVSGDKIKYLYLKLPNVIRDKVIGFNTVLPKQFNLHTAVDYETMFEKVFLSPIEIMAKPLKWSVQPESGLKGLF